LYRPAIRTYFFILIALAACIPVQAQTMGTGYFRGKAVTYRITGGLAITEGDIVLGPADQIPQTLAEPTKFTREAVSRTSQAYRWPDGVVPYEIDSGLPNQQRVTAAVEHWNANTDIRLVPHTDEPNYVKFVRASGVCSSYVGMVSLGAQTINLGDSCDTGNTIHEIGHAVGLFHEQSRQDRDFYMRVLYQNLDKQDFAQYNQQLSGATDTVFYDYGSIMHYNALGFTRNNKPTLVSIPQGIPFGQRAALSAGDLEAVKRLYGRAVDGTTFTTSPTGMKVTVDGQQVSTPAVFHWAEGTTHSIGVPVPQGSGNDRYLFGRWSDDGEQTHTITASAGQTIYSANFIHQYKLPVTAGTGGTVQVSPTSSDGFYPEGTELELTPIPDNGYYFLSWTGFGYFSQHGVSPNPLRFTIDGQAVRYTATFTKTPPTTITSEPLGRAVSVDGVLTVLPRSFTWAAGSSHTVSVPQTQQSGPNGVSRFVFQGWSDGGDASHSVTAGETASTISANFATQYQVTTSVSPISGGTLLLSPASTDGFYDAGTTVTATPVPNGPYKFRDWGDDGTESLVVDDQKLLTATFAVPHQITGSSTVNAANYAIGAVAPGEMVTIFGLELGPDDLTTLQLTSAGRANTTLAGARVYFDGVAAPLVYAAKNQLSAVVPYSVEGAASTRMRVELNGQASNTVTLGVVASKPALFTYDSSGKGPAAAANQDGSTNSELNPALKGSTVVLYATGEGATTPAGVDGKPGAVPLPRPKLLVSVKIANREAIVDYAGAAPGFVAGLMQVNVRIPADCPSGAVPVVLAVGDSSSLPNVTLWVQ
jgi:astacin